MRLLATGDLHCHNHQQFSYTRKDGTNSRLYQCLKVFKILRKEAERRGINKVLINGDIFQEVDYIDVNVYDSVYRELESLHDDGIDVALPPGNHDVCLQSFGRSLHSLRPFRKVAQVIETPTIVWGGLQVIPWQPEKQLKETLKHLKPSDGLALHAGIQGATTGPNKALINNLVQLSDIRRKRFGLVILSDYHSSQWLAKNVLYMGSPLQHSFGEVHRPAIWSIKLNESGFSAEPIYTNLPRFRRVDYSNAQQMFEKHEGDYFRVHVPIGKRVREEELEQLAKTYHCQIQLVHEAGQKASEALPETVEMAEALRAYAHSQVQGKKARRRLLGAGRALLARKPCFGVEKG